MAIHNCPFCNGHEITALGASVASGHVVVEQQCRSCGHLFSITDRRKKTLRIDASPYKERPFFSRPLHSGKRRLFH